MQEAQEMAIKNYQENMEYFKQNQPEVYSKLSALEILINDGSYPQKYDLEYQDGYFDVIELASGTKLYNSDSQQISKELLSHITYKKDDQLFQSKRNLKYEKSALEYIIKSDVYTKHSTTAELSDYYHSVIDISTSSMIEIDKFIFIGTGLGLHIEGIVKKFDLQAVLIIEDDVELFRLSMFSCNYKTSLGNAAAFFSIGQNSEEFHFLFYEFFIKFFIHNMYLKFCIFSSSHENKIQQIQNLLISRPESTYSIERILLKNKKVTSKLSQEYNFLNIAKKLNEDFFDDKPILILGAGPSLHKNLQWIQDNHNKFIVITSLVGLKTLKKIDVSPDILVQIDEDEPTTRAAFEHLGDLDFLKNTICVFSASVPELLFEKFTKEKIFLHEDRTMYKLHNSTSIVSSVGESMYTIALTFNTPNIYLLGIDLALGDDGETHSPDHFRPMEIDENEDHKQGYDLGRSIIKTKGNFQTEVNTIPMLFLSIPVFNSKTYALKTEKQNIYNLSDGVYLEQTIPMRSKDCKLKNSLDKTNLGAQLQELFTSYSTYTLSSMEREALTYRVEHIELFKNLLKKFEESPYANVDLFLQNYTDMMSEMLNSKYDDELKELTLVFYLSLAPFISDLFNTQELNNKKKHIKKIRKILLTHLYKVIEAYETSLNTLIS